MPDTGRPIHGIQHRILFVDDEQHVLDGLARMLHSERHRWEMTFVTCPFEALDLLHRLDFDAVVTDVQMPGMSGLELLRRLREMKHTRYTPVVVLTALGDRALKRQALDLGATDLLNKPADVSDLLARLRNMLRLKVCQDEMRCRNQLLELEVCRRTKQLEASQLEIIWRLAKAAEFRDEDTGNHILRVGYISRTIGEALGLDRKMVSHLFLASPLHDIGKIGVPDSILLKPGKLTDEEWRVMQRHCEFGAAILQAEPVMGRAIRRRAIEAFGTDGHSVNNPILDMAATIALTHHEKWDGSGYPRGLAGEAIPLVGRIVAMADVFDALRSERPYKMAHSEEDALAIIRQGRDRHFDPQVCEAFERSLPAIRDIFAEFTDDAADASPLAELTGLAGACPAPSGV